MCGLSAAYHLQQAGADFLLLERESQVGGLPEPKPTLGVLFDHSIQILFPRDSYVTDLICQELLPDNIAKQSRQSYCYTAGVYTQIPQPDEQLRAAARPKNIAENLRSLLKAERATPNGAPAHFEDWILQTFGQVIAEHFSCLTSAHHGPGM
jgi:protoporphyrinogen oxidase